MADAPYKPSGHSSVMAMRLKDQAGLDYFPTPPWAARAGGELIRELDPDAKTCWEPACGGGHMVHGLVGYFDRVHVSDIKDYGYPALTMDFLGDLAAPRPWSRADWVVTNPPFKAGEAFFRQAWSVADRGVAMLLRLSFIESAARYRLFSDMPLTVLAPFSERVPMVKGRWDPKASSATSYAWFLCAKPVVARQAFEPVVRWIPPGSKARLSCESDVQIFGGGR